MKKLKILYLEDNVTDFELTKAILEKEQLLDKIERVETRQQFQTALENNDYDIILSDYSLTDFDGISALKIVLEKYPETPFIILSGSLGEELAIDTLKMGATDYVLKQRISRLIPAVRRAVKESEEKTRLRIAEAQSAAALEALKESEENFRTLVENSFDGILINDVTGNYLYANNRAAEISGYSISELLKLNVIDLTPSEDKNKIVKRVKKRIENNHTPDYFESVLVRKDGKEIPIELTAAPTIWKNKPAEIVSVRDITERKQAEKEKALLQSQLQQAQKMETIGALAGGIAHDFNNLLTVIQGNVQLARMKYKDSRELDSYLEQVQNSSDRAAKLTRQLLTFSRKQPINLSILNINTVIEDMLKMLQRLIGEDISIDTNLSPELPSIKGDEGNIEQVIMNLVINARDAMPEGGEILLKTENVELHENEYTGIIGSYPGEFVCLTIRDTGAGIDEKNLSKIFEPFFTTKDKETGTGLGLSVVYGIVKQHKGFIQVQSKLQEGTTFKIYFPASGKVQFSGTDNLKSSKLKRGKGERILLVEDNDAIRSLFSNALAMQGFEVTTAIDAEDAIIRFTMENGNYDLVISDIVMPGKSGLELADELRSRKPEIGVILMSGYLDKKIKSLEITQKEYKLLRKPCEIATLLNTVAEVLEK
ncbi:MAG: response regulator [Candidatus Marinimicrobia bacterium]|nr:response regulator [Candidatus Neomarinimicrobiota bacterium]